MGTSDGLVEIIGGGKMKLYNRWLCVMGVVLVFCAAFGGACMLAVVYPIYLCLGLFLVFTFAVAYWIK